ncbi:MAG: hypothetical protein ACFHWZ_02360 [Phycisphaerales bacterium]
MPISSRTARFTTLFFVLLAQVAWADIINVPGDFPTIQQAIDASVDGDEIIVAPGTYSSASILALVDDKAITLRSSGGAGVTVLEATGIVGIARLANVESDTVIEGFTFRGVEGVIPNAYVLGIFSGSPVVRDCVFEDNNNSSGIRPVVSGSTMSGTTIIGCIFRNNGTASVFCTNQETVDLTIEDCAFTGNTIGAANSSTVYLRCSAEVRNCTFDANSNLAGPGGAIFADGSAGGITIDSCTFTGNTSSESGGAIYAAVITGTAGTTTISGCEFDGNSAETAGGVHAFKPTSSSGSVSVTSSVFTNNTANDGAGIILEDASTSGCSFISNHASGDAGGILVLGTECVISDCDASNNTAGGVGGGLRVPAGITASITNSVLCDNTPDQYALDGVLFASALLVCDQMGPSTGACCLNDGSCVELSQATCDAVGGTYQGDDSLCADASCPAPCFGDANNDGVVDLADLNAVLAAFGQVCP